MPSTEAYGATTADPDPYADLLERTALTDDAGQLALVFSPGVTATEDTPCADCVWVPADVDVRSAAGLATSAMAGWLLSTSDHGLVTALIAAGAVERRHAHAMTHDLHITSLAASQTVAAIEFAAATLQPLTPSQVRRHAARLGAVCRSAYPGDHPDAFTGTEPDSIRYVRAIADGQLLGPMSATSRVALVGSAIVGACFVVDREGGPPHGGPWVINVFRDPTAASSGIGQALLTSSLLAARDAGLPGLSLVVSATNEAARRLYARLGFVEVEESWTLALP